MKTIQILELLGPSKIWLEFKNKKKKRKSFDVGINTGFADINAGVTSMSVNQNNVNRGTTYDAKSGFYFNIQNLIKHISNSKHIFMSRDDYEKDFELRYLIRSRIRSFLKTYSRTLNIKNLSSLESKMQISLKSIYGQLGLDFNYNNSG